MALNQESEDQAYVLGRLFAVLESIQKDANPGINTTIRDRYFNSACATPALVFPILIKLKNSHTKKLEREHPEKKKWYELFFKEICDDFPDFSLEKVQICVIRALDGDQIRICARFGQRLIHRLALCVRYRMIIGAVQQ